MTSESLLIPPVGDVGVFFSDDDKCVVSCPVLTILSSSIKPSLRRIRVLPKSAMSPHRSLSYSSHRQPTAIQDIFLGIAFALDPPSSDKPHTRTLRYTAVLHDGTGVVETETFHYPYQHEEGEDAIAGEAKKVSQEILQLMRRIQTKKGMNVGISPYWL